MPKPTYTLLPDPPDPAPRPCNVEQMQQDYLDAIFGKGWEARLQEAENAHCT